MSGESGEYEQLIGPIEDQMIRSVWRIVRNEPDFGDAFQDATVRVWERRKRIRRHPNPHALVLRICVNSAYDVLRRNARRRRREELVEIPTDIPDPAPSPAEQWSARATLNEAFRAIARLPRKQAEATLMRFVQGLPYAEVAEVTGCNEATARTHVARARARLREQLTRSA